MLNSSWVVQQGAIANGIATLTPTASGDRRLYQIPSAGGWSWQANTTYTVSIDAKSSNGAQLLFYAYGANAWSSAISVTSEWKRYSFTFTSTTPGTTSMTFQVNQTSGVTLELKRPKLEISNYATPWIPNKQDAEYFGEECGYVDGFDTMKMYKNYIQVNELIEY